jgi:hypothetical protein
VTFRRAAPPENQLSDRGADLFYRPLLLRCGSIASGAPTDPPPPPPKIEKKLRVGRATGA